MKLCFPIQDNNGLSSEIFNHFGNAPRFLVYNTEKKEILLIENQDLGHLHGHCNPMRALSGQMVDAVVVGGIGAGALKGLNNMGIRVFQTTDGDIQAHIDLYNKGKLKETTLMHTCGGHGQMCAHDHDPGQKPL